MLVTYLRMPHRLPIVSPATFGRLHVNALRIHPMGLCDLRETVYFKLQECRLIETWSLMTVVDMNLLKPFC